MTMAATADDHPTLRTALTYAARGWRVVPIPPGQKHPAIPAWQTAGTTDTDRIRHWWTQAPTHGIGIVTGPDSGIFVVDVDVAGDKQGDESLHELEQAYGPLPPTYEVITGTGGRHLYYRWPSGGHVIRNSASGALGPGIDVRGEGGQVLAPPTIHPNGRPYAREASSPDQPTDAPSWLIALLTPAPAATPPPQPQIAPRADRPGDLWAAQTAWADLLGPDGWTLHHTDPDGEQHWTRPGKDPREGTSATVNYKGSGLLKIFTTSAAGLEAEKTYSKLGYLAATQYGGDHAAAAKALADAGWRPPDTDLHTLAGTTAAPGTSGATASPEPAGTDLPDPINWSEFWSAPPQAEWLIEPIIPAGRHVVLYAPAKMGKSLLALEIAAAAATGRKVLGQPRRDPIHVVYLDLEMTADDLYERLEDMGYGPDDNLDRLHYYSLPSLPPLDTTLGGQIVAQLAQRDGAQLIVIDTMARVVSGEENDADTYRAFDRATSLPLKAAGVAVLRLDHAGKDLTKGQRGSSEKVGYADLVWQLLYGEGGTGTLKATHRRIGWAPEVVTIRRIEEPSLRHELTHDETWPIGTKECAEDLDRLGVDLVLDSTRAAQQALQIAGCGRRRALVVAALRWRRVEATDALGNLVGKPVDNSRMPRSAVPGTTLAKTPPQNTGTGRTDMPPDQQRDHSGTTRNQDRGADGTPCVPSRGTRGPSTQPQPAEPESIFDIDLDAEEP